MQGTSVVVVGGGIYGFGAALELGARGYAVTLLDRGPIPHPLAASTDISKAMRGEYGADEEYTALIEEAREGWLRWNEEFGETLYFEWGVTMLTTAPMQPGGYEYESFRIVQRRGGPIERLDSAAIARRFPAWNADRYVDGFFSARAGWTWSGRIIERLSEKARRSGITIVENQTADEVLYSDGESGRVRGVRTREGQYFLADAVVVAAGAWTQYLLPDLKPVLRSTGMPVAHLTPDDPTLFSPPLFCNWTADITNTGYYGFPYHPEAKVVKVGYHGPGPDIHPEEDPRVVNEYEIQRLRGFLADTFPALAHAPITYTRRCLYSDTIDEHFILAEHPAHPGLVVAAGDSGHGFKFGPLYGELLANALERRHDPRLHKFRWRTAHDMVPNQEASRLHEAA
jgi:glycine/D-amino acid oxidase-like deaminating enzyme